MSSSSDTRQERRDFIWRVLIGIALVGGAAVLAYAIDIVLIVFGGVLFAVFLTALSRPVARWSGLSDNLALSAVLLTLVALLVGSGLIIAPQLAEQASEIRDAIPTMVEQSQEFIERIGLGAGAGDDVEMEDVASGVATGFFALMGGLTKFTAFFLTFLFVGIFLAYKPNLYVNGMISLVPADYRPALRDLSNELGYTIRWWLIGRAIAMVLVGVSTWLLLTILGAPLALFVGILTGLLTFIPYLGPVLGMIPVTLAGVLEDPTIGLYALGLYFVIENIEGYVLDPLIQEQVVYLPPALTIAVQMIMGFVIGPLGIALATPLAAIGLVVTNRAYLGRDSFVRENAPESEP